jgi:hypothetical protein
MAKQQKPFDWSQLGIKNQEAPAQNNQQKFDWSQLGIQSEQPAQAHVGAQMSANNQQKPLLNQVTESAPFNALLGAGDAIRDLMSLGYTKGNPTGEGVGYKVGNILGDIGGFVGGGELLDAARVGIGAAPLIGKGAQWLGKEGIPAVTKRLAGSSIFGAAQEPEDRLKGAGEGLKNGAIGEALTLPFHAIGKIAEVTNPVKYSAKEAEKIRGEYQAAKIKQAEAYAPVTAKYGESWLTPKPESFLGFNQGEIKYFTPEVKKVYKDFLDEPSFQNLHNLQSQMGKDAARISTSGNKINTSQTLTAARDRINEKISAFLKKDPKMHEFYEKGRTITREEVSPFTSNPTLAKISQGLNTHPSPEQLHKAITKSAQKMGRMEGGKAISALPESHYLAKALEKLGKKMSNADLVKSILPIVGGAGGGLIGGAPLGAALGLGGHYGMKVAQNPFVESIARSLAKATRTAPQIKYER